MSALPLSAILLSILIHCLWGGNVVAGKFGLELFPPFYSAMVRFLIGVLTMWLWCSWRGLQLWPKPHEWRWILIVSGYFTVQIGLMNLGFDNTSGSNASILISTNPLFAAFFAHFLIAGDRLTLVRSAGLMLAFAGVVLTLLFSSNVSDPVSQAGRQTGLHFGNAGDWLCLASACLLGFRLIESARALRKIDPVRLAFWQMLLSIPVFLLMGLMFESFSWEQYSWRAMAGLAYQGIVIAGFCFMASLWLMSRYRPSLMASFGFLAPVSGVLLSIWLLDESFSGAIAASVVLVAAGMTLLTLSSRGALPDPDKERVRNT